MKPLKTHLLGTQPVFQLSHYEVILALVKATVAPFSLYSLTQIQVMVFLPSIKVCNIGNIGYIKVFNDAVMLNSSHLELMPVNSQ